MIKIEDLTLDELMDIYTYIRLGHKKKVISENEYQAITKMLTDELGRRHRESPLW